MELEGKIDDGLLKTLFENGLMGVEIPEKYGGSGCNFMTSIIVVEEISKGNLSGIDLFIYDMN